MSDSEGDFSDELLELAGATEKKRRKHQSNHSNKKQKSNVSMESDDSDQDVDSEDDSNPFPLEGKYVDEADRERLLEMTEIEREEILASRMEQLQRKQDSKNLDALLKAQKAGGEGSDSVSKAAKRQHAARGATKEKSNKLDELKAKRRAKEQKKRTRTGSPRGDRDSSPMDMETSSGEEEDGQISKFEEDEDMFRKFSGKVKDDNDEPITLQEISAIRVTRDILARHCLAPWFEDYVKGTWVRYLIGNEKDGRPVYRVCEVQGLAMNLTKPYKINNTLIDRAIEIKHGKSVRAYNMDKVSNAEFPDSEWERVRSVCAAEHVALPTRRAIEKKKEQMKRLVTQPMTDSDITAMLARKNQLSSGVQQSSAAITLERSRLIQARTLALRRQDAVEVAEIDVKLAALPEVATTRTPEEDDVAARLAKVNERNRKANLEAVRKAELQEVERKRRERKLANANGSGVTTPIDPSARLRTIPKTFSNQSRSATPVANGTPQIKSEKDALRPVSPLPPSALSSTTTASDKLKSFQASVIDSVEVDLGDF